MPPKKPDTPELNLTEETVSAVAPAPKKSMFAAFAALDTSGGDLINFEIQMGNNIVRILPGEPFLVLKHWDHPQSGGMVAAPCRRNVPQDLYFEMAAAQDAGPEAYEAFMSQFGKCELCEYADKHSGFYTVKKAYVFFVVQDGVVKMWEVSQPSILKQIMALPEDSVWGKRFKNPKTGEEDLTRTEIVIKKESTGPKPQNIKYTVMGNPDSEQLEQEVIDEYVKSAPDVVAIKTPPLFDVKGNEKWAEIMAKCPEPKDGEKPKSPGQK